MRCPGWFAEKILNLGAEDMSVERTGRSVVFSTNKEGSHGSESS